MSAHQNKVHEQAAGIPSTDFKFGYKATAWAITPCRQCIPAVFGSASVYELMDLQWRVHIVPILVQHLPVSREAVPHPSHHIFPSLFRKTPLSV